MVMLQTKKRYFKLGYANISDIGRIEFSHGGISIPENHFALAHVKFFSFDIHYCIPSSDFRPNLPVFILPQRTDSHFPPPWAHPV